MNDHYMLVKVPEGWFLTAAIVRIEADDVEVVHPVRVDCTAAAEVVHDRITNFVVGSRFRKAVEALDSANRAEALLLDHLEDQWLVAEAQHARQTDDGERISLEQVRTEMRITSDFQALVAGMLLETMYRAAASEHLLATVEPQDDDNGNHLPWFDVVGQETGTRVRVTVETIDIDTTGR